MPPTITKIALIILIISTLNKSFGSISIHDYIIKNYMCQHQPMLLLQLAKAYSCRDINKAYLCYDSIINIATQQKDTALLVHCFIFYSYFIKYSLNKGTISREYLNRALLLISNQHTQQSIADSYLIQGVLASVQIKDYSDQVINQFDTFVIHNYMQSIHLQTDDFIKAQIYEYLEIYNLDFYNLYDTVESYKQRRSKPYYYDSAVYYYNKAKCIDGVTINLFHWCNAYRYECQCPKRNVQHCKQKDSLLQAAQKLADSTGNILVHGRVANIHAYKEKDRGNYSAAMQFLQEAERSAEQMHDKNQALRYLYTYQDVYVAQKDYKKAYFAVLNINKVKDSIGMLNNIDELTFVQNRYENQARDIKINKLLNEKVIKEEKQRLLFTYISFIILFLSVVIVVLLIYLRQRSKISNQIKKNAELNYLLKQNLEHQLVDVQEQFIRSHMNPHFIFNALNSIQTLILVEDSKRAVIYLQKFAQLSRITIEHLRKEYIPLDVEISFLTKYLEMEQLRYDYIFDFEITVGNDVDAEMDEIPPMFVQPFVENAIKHGILPKNEKGLIKVDFNTKFIDEQEVLICTIEDDGVGFMKSQEHRDSEHKSIALKLIQDRMQLFGEKDALKSKYKLDIEEINDAYNTCIGSRIVLTFGSLSNKVKTI
jgi:Histidine kinase